LPPEQAARSKHSKMSVTACLFMRFSFVGDRLVL
jgi:hypothetical protein